jgi:hypothetical protein
LDNGFFKLPISIIPQKAQITIESLCHSKYVFNQPLSKMESKNNSHTIIPEEIVYWNEQCGFCSFECMENFVEMNVCDYTFVQSFPIIFRMKKNANNFKFF